MADRGDGQAVRPRRRRIPLPYLLVMVIVAYLGVFILFPITQQFLTSFSNNVVGVGDVRWVGLRNYERLVADDDFWFAVRVTFVYMFFVVVGSVAIGLFAALMLNRTFRGRNAARSVIAIPWAFPEVSAVLVFLWMCNPTFGVMNVFARWIPGIDENLKWLSDPNLAMPLVIALSVWKAFPFTALVILAALQTVPQDLYEAARVDGASRIQSFRFITIPAISPTLMLMAVPSFADGEDTVDAATKEKLTALLVGQGYDVRKIEHEDGLIEVYVVKDGATEELFFDEALNPVEHEG